MLDVVKAEGGARMAETWADRIVEALRLSRLPLDDDELARRLGAPQRQTINQTCRRLEADGVLRRYQGSDGKLVNRLAVPDISAADVVTASSIREGLPLPTQSRPPLLTEDEVKAAIETHLKAAGWSVHVAWGHERGIDISAHQADKSLYLEAKGEAANPPQQVNYFLGALGELVQRLTDPSATYGLALPDNPQYRGLVDRLPRLAFERLNLVVYFVGCDADHLVRSTR